MHENSQLLFEKHARPLFHAGLRVLEIGPDSFPSTYRHALKDVSLEWHTLDRYESPNLTYPSSDEYSFPHSGQVLRYHVVWPSHRACAETMAMGAGIGTSHAKERTGDHNKPGLLGLP